MYKRKIIDKLLHFLVHNSFLFTVMIMCLVHACLLVITAYAGVTPLAMFNVLSVIVYLFCIVLCRVGQILPVYVSVFVEVCAYAITSVYFVGWSCGSLYFLFSIVPIVIFFGGFLFKGPKRLIVILMRDYDLSASRHKMDSIRRLIEATPTVFYNKRIAVTITVGVEENKECYLESEEIIKVADERMYYGKQHGKNIVIYEGQDKCA